MLTDVTLNSSVCAIAMYGVCVFPQNVSSLGGPPAMAAGYTPYSADQPPAGLPPPLPPSSPPRDAPASRPPTSYSSSPPTTSPVPMTMATGSPVGSPAKQQVGMLTNIMGLAVIIDCTENIVGLIHGVPIDALCFTF